jgi:hypothetical protein
MLAVTEHRVILRYFILALALVCSSCAGGKLSSVGGDGALPSELSPEFKQKFEIKEISPTTATPAAVVSTVSEKHVKTKKAKAETKKGQPSKFAYPTRRPQKDPIWPGEKLTYDVMYFGLSAGEFTTEVMPYKEINSRKVYYIRGTAISTKLFSLFYRLNDTIETFIDYDGFFSHRFHMLLDESKQNRDSLELYDSEKGETFFWNRVNHKDKGFAEVKTFAPMPAFSQDTLSAAYYLRTVPLPDGAVVNVPIVSEAKSWEAVMTVIRREQVDAPMGKTKAVVLKVETKYQGVLKKQGDSFIWLSDDDRRLLLRLEAKVKVGTVVGALKKAELGTPPQPQPQAETTRP